MENFDEESDDGEYHYSDGEIEYPDGMDDGTDMEDIQSNAGVLDANVEDACVSNELMRAKKLTDLEFDSHSNTADIQKFLIRDNVPDGKAVFVDYW